MFNDTIHLIAVLEESEAPKEELALLPEYEDVCQDDYRVIVIYGENKRQILYAEDNIHGRPFDVYEGILQGLRYAEKNIWVETHTIYVPNGKTYNYNLIKEKFEREVLGL